MRRLCETLSLLFALTFASSQAHGLCGGPLNDTSFGRPLNFNDSQDADDIYIVEKYHFTPEVEALLAGPTQPVPFELHYTLKHIPNHSRALWAMARWQLENPRPPDVVYYTAECYFQRSLAFQPEESVTYQLYGLYEHKRGNFDAALLLYDSALKREPHNAEVYYNLGLLYVDLDDFEQARASAEKAYGLGYPLPGLQRKLERLGEW